MLGMKIVISHDGVETRDAKSNTLALDTNVAYDSQEMADRVIRFGELIAAKLPEGSMVMHGVVWHIDPKTGGVLGDESRTVPINKPGKFKVPSGDRMANKSVVVCITKLCKGGVGGRLNLRNVITAKETSAYRITGVPPARFTDPDTLADGLSTNLLEGLKNLGDTTHKLAVAKKKARQNVTPNLITSFEFGGIKNNQTTRARTSAKSKSIKGAQQKINTLAREARFAQREDANGAIPDGADALVKRLKAEAKAIFDKLDVAEQSRIIWPDIFDLNPLNDGDD